MFESIMSYFISFVGSFIGLAAVCILLYKAFVAVPQQNAFVIERFGKYEKTLHSGLGLIVPFVDEVAYKHVLKEIAYDVSYQACITKDNSQVTLDGVLYFKVVDPKLASYGISDYVFAIVQLAQTTLRDEVGKRNLDVLLSDRAEINVAIVDSLDKASNVWGVKVLRYEVKDILPPESVLAAMEMQFTAERRKRALIAQSEGEMEQAINVANGQKKAAISVAEGEAIAMKSRAEGEAASIVAIANAQAESIKAVSVALNSEGGERAASLKIAEQYIEAFSKIAKETNTVVVPANLSDLAGMISGAMAVLPKPQKP